jgi:hypothetical protein
MKTDSFTTNFVADACSSDAGIRKQAAADFNKWLVTYQRQDGVFRKYMPPTPVTKEDFAETIETRDPVIIRTIKPRSAGAISTNFNTGTISTGMYADKYTIYLHRAWTPKYRIEKIYLAAYKGDLIGMYKDLSLQDLLGNEDAEGMSLINACIGEKSKVNEEIGIKQYINAGEKVTPENIAHAIKGLLYSYDNPSPAKALVHRTFWFDIFTSLQAHNYGDRVAENALVGDVKALEENLLGLKWLTVLEKHVVPYKAIYTSADSEWCGDFVTFGEAEVFNELIDGIWFEMFAHEVYGMSTPYRGAFTRADFGEAQESWTNDSVN